MGKARHLVIYESQHITPTASTDPFYPPQQYWDYESHPAFTSPAPRYFFPRFSGVVFVEELGEMWYQSLVCVEFCKASLIATFLGLHLRNPPLPSVQSLRRVEVLFPDTALHEERSLKGLAELGCLSRSAHVEVKFLAFAHKMAHDYVMYQLPHAIEAFVADLASIVSVLQRLHALGHRVDLNFSPERIVTVGDTDCHLKGILEGLLSGRKV
jgi:hypothetical protein